MENKNLKFTSLIFKTVNNTKIETVESFLNRGGIIQTIPAKAATSDKKRSRLPKRYLATEYYVYLFGRSF